jgi:CHAD domain-containing protein
LPDEQPATTTQAATSPQSVMETERKFRVHGLYRLPDLVSSGAVAGVDDLGVVMLDATYYDTDDLRLAREGITLRRRSGGDDEGWHLKLPVSTIGAARTREEIQLPLEAGDVADDVPDQLRHLVGAMVRSDELRPVATLHTERHGFRLTPVDAQEPVAVLTDDVVSVLDNDGTLVARFRELELEDLPDVDPAQAEASAASVSTTLVSAGDVTPDDPGRDAVRAHIARHTRRLRAADLAVRRDLDDSVHQMRVSARRLRSGLRVFRPLLDREWADSLRTELAWVAGELGDYRDTEVLLDRLERHLDLVPDGVDPGPARKHVEKVLTARLGAARERALEMLDSKRYFDLQARLIDASDDPVTTAEADLPAREVIPPLVRRAWKKLAKEAEQLLADEQDVPGGAPDSEWHASRITAKKARYAVEAAAPVFGEEAAAFGKQLSRVTEILGDHQDAAIAIERIKGLAAEKGVTAAAAFGLGALLSVEHDSVADTRTDFSTLWPDVSRRRWRRWLST